MQKLFIKKIFIFRRTDISNSSEITLESFMQSRQEAERRIQSTHVNMRAPQYTAPPPPPGSSYYFFDRKITYINM